MLVSSLLQKSARRGRGTDVGNLETGAGTIERHPWSSGFEWRSPEGSLRALDREQAERFDRDGFVVLDAVFDAGQVTQVTREIDRVEAKVDAFLRSQDGQRVSIAEAGAITFTTHLVTRSPLLRSFVTHPTLLGLCADLVGPDVNLYWDQAVYKKPTKPRRFPWHQDNGYSYVEPQQYLTCWIALTDATVANGCPQVAPGLHRLGTIRHRYVDPLGWECFAEAPEAVAAPVGAGGVVVFSSLTPHLTGPNTTDDVRKAYIVQYAPAGARAQKGDPAAGPPTGEDPCDDPDRQFPVLRGGRPVRAGEAGEPGDLGREGGP
jgi:ectoine hydroxylase-related dioxygenase (phytanoyl-CoA dioxygenase family)